MNPSRRTLFVGFIQWLSVGVGLIGAYMLTLDSFTEWNWFVVITGALGHAGVGLGALAKYMGVGKPVTQKKPAKKLSADIDLQDELDSFRDTAPAIPLVEQVRAAIRKNWFTRQELECKGQNCNCIYPGMEESVMAIANDLRDKFGPIVVTSAFRCPEHNAEVGGSKSSYHMRAMAVDVKAVNATPEELYRYLTNKYVGMYGFGLYERFIHADSRVDSWARKPAPDKPWQSFETEIIG